MFDSINKHHPFNQLFSTKFSSLVMILLNFIQYGYFTVNVLVRLLLKCTSSQPNKPSDIKKKFNFNFFYVGKVFQIYF